MLAVILFAIAISVDGFVAGVAEGLRGIRVPVSSLVVVNLVSAAVVFVSLSGGHLVAGWLTPVAGRLIGGGILVCLGAWMLRPGPREARRRSRGQAGAGIRSGPGKTDGVAIPRCNPEDAQESFRRQCDTSQQPSVVSTLMLVPRFLDEPAKADLDLSGVLSAGEAFFLGLALAIDALGVGFGAGMAGLSGTLTPIVAGVTQYIFVSAGLGVGSRMKMSALGPKLEKIPGGILILLGVLRLR
ncbi:MAG: manganese efflux pump [Bacillota bacterium]